MLLSESFGEGEVEAAGEGDGARPVKSPAVDFLSDPGLIRNIIAAIASPMMISIAKVCAGFQTTGGQFHKDENHPVTLDGVSGPYLTFSSGSLSFLKAARLFNSLRQSLHTVR